MSYHTIKDWNVNQDQNGNFFIDKNNFFIYTLIIKIFEYQKT